MKKAKQSSIDLSKLNGAQIAHNYLMKTKGGNYTIEDLNWLNGYINEVLANASSEQKKLKVGLMFVCINQPYWQYIQPVVEGAKAYFLPGHDTEIMVWSDVPKKGTPEAQKMIDEGAENKEYLEQVIPIISDLNVTVFPVESQPWPYPTLMRYHMFLSEEEYLKKFDYIFYLDLDMRIVNIVGDEILGEGLTAAQHPMYALRQQFWYPYEPNPESAAYIKATGRLLEAPDGRKLFEPLYAAGGFQGGKTQMFIDAMKAMKEGINKDFKRNYIARWNDESHWNKYLYDNPPSVVLSPSYVYPDSLIEQYYVKLWGCNYAPKIITLTKPFSVSKEGGEAAAEMIKTL